ncbi:MAG TPA: alkene reductase, partial [Dongiaceae bacterium]
GANGYLLDQFLRDSTNKRGDAYGGPVANRARLLLEVAEAVVGVLGAGRVGVRLSPLNPFNDMADSDPRDTFGYAAKELGRLGLGYLHLTRGGDPGDFDWHALRSDFGGKVILNGGFDRAGAHAALAAGIADLIAFGTAYLANPDLAERLRQGAALNPPQRETFYGGDARGYIDYPSLEGAA